MLEGGMNNEPFLDHLQHEQSRRLEEEQQRHMIEEAHRRATENDSPWFSPPPSIQAELRDAELGETLQETARVFSNGRRSGRTRAILREREERGIPEPVLQATRDMKIPDMDISIVGGKVYTINPLGVKIQDTITYLRRYYNDQFINLKMIEQEQSFREAMNQWQNQLDVLNRHRNRGTIVVPSEMSGKPIMVHDGTVCFVRWVKFCPNEIVGPVGYIKNRLTESGEYSRNGKKIYEAIKGESSDVKFILLIKQDKINTRVMFAYSPTKKLIYTPQSRLFHTLGVNTRKLCIGEHEAKRFWEDPLFDDNVNRINLFSPATNDIEFTNDGELQRRTCSINNLLTDTYVTAIQKVEEGKWKV